MSAFAKASLAAKTDQSGRAIPVAARQWLPVDFNPETLKVSISNAMRANTKRGKKEPPQFVADSTAKLSVELVFDSTTYGNDVREMTSLVAQMMKPKGPAQQQKKKKGIPAIVIFEWGTFLFEGYIESFNETLDFFAAEGVPLRSTLSLSITEQDDPFRAPSGDGAAVVAGHLEADAAGKVGDLINLAIDRGKPRIGMRVAVYRNDRVMLQGLVRDLAGQAARVKVVQADAPTFRLDRLAKARLFADPRKLAARL